MKACVPASITAQPTSGPVWIPLNSSSTLSIGVAGPGTVTVDWFTDSGTPVGSGLSLPVTPTLHACYYAIVSNGCQTVKSADVWVMIATPVITDNPKVNRSTISVGQSATLEAGGGTGLGPFTFKWYTSDGTYFADGKKCVVRPLVTTSYYYTLNNAWESAPSNLITVTVQ
ncbi:MAG TPA: hypothetical protein VNN08_23895 [Thermoanaerobaculia bacterium]|nr:hypothetical protein [Thermoanaerobaculia bacterium]